MNKMLQRKPGTRHTASSTDRLLLPLPLGLRFLFFLPFTTEFSEVEIVPTDRVSCWLHCFLPPHHLTSVSLICKMGTVNPLRVAVNAWYDRYR